MHKEFNKDYDTVYVNCLKAARQCGFNIKSENISTGIITYKVSLSAWSWGETFTISIAKITDLKTKVEVSSSNFQVIDWGKNKENVEQFFQTVNTLIK